MGKETDFWDRVAGIYDVFVNVINAKTHKALLTELEPLFDSLDTVLECACGTGMRTEIIAPKCKKLIATDFSKNMLKKAKVKCNRYSNVEFMTADILHLSFADNSFNKVVAANVIHLLHEPYEALKELDRVCCSGGKIIIPTYINSDSQKGERVFAKIAGKIGAGLKQKFTFSSYEKFFADAGFSDVEYIAIEGRIPCSVAVINSLKEVATLP